MSNRYFRDDNFAGRLLRFLNLLEPGAAVLSISKIFMWFMIGVTIYVLVKRPDDLISLISTIGGMLVCTGNYAYRRHMKYQEKMLEKDDDGNDIGSSGG